MTVAIEVENIHWRYPSFIGQENPWAINGVNLSISKGEFFGITGPSGAGKTTLCRLIMGLLPHGTKIPFRQVNYHIRGSVRLLGEQVTHIDEQANVVDGVPLGELQGKGILSPRIGMVMQDPENQFLQMSLFHEIAFGLSLQDVAKDEILDRAKKSLEMVGLEYLWDDAEYIHPLDLSGGQKQRVAVAAFLSLRPEVLILDEPTSDLDPLGKYEIIQTVKKLKEEQGMTIILVEQDPELLYNFCDRIALVDQGQIVTIAEPKAFFRQVDLLEEHGVAPFEVTQIARATGLEKRDLLPLTIEETIPLFEGKKVNSAPQAAINQAAEPVIQVENVCYRYQDGTEALRGANLTVRQGEIVALLGNNGSGKTTLAKILTGIYAPGSGLARVMGRDLSKRKVRRNLPQWIGYVFQNPDHQLFTRRVYDEVEYGLINLNVPAAKREDIIHKTLEVVGLADKEDEDPLFLGKGQRQRLAVAVVLAMGPEILIVDEPTTGQDYRMISGIMSLLDELHKQNKTILIITHDMSLVANHCDRAVVLRDGQTVFDGEPRELFAKPPLLESTHLRSTQSVGLSLALQKKNPQFPILLKVHEWAEIFAETEKS
jgi:energy-coupling factor transport system ATP-binding protein